MSLKFSESANRNWKHFCDIFTSAARSIRSMTEINVYSTADDLSTPRSEWMPSYLGPNPSAWWLKSMPPLMGLTLCTSDCTAGRTYPLHDKSQCRPSWGKLHSVRASLLGLNPTLYKTSISLKVKTVFIVVDSGLLAVPCPFVSGSLVSSNFLLISSFGWESILHSFNL